MSNQKIVTETALSALASDIKTALSGKANSNDVYPKSQTYNRTEIDNALDLKADKSELYNVYPTDQESGSIAHITDGANNIPVKSLVSEIVAVESGSGEKSPTNPYTISGFDNGIITRCGKNLIDDSKYYQLNANIVVVGQTETNANRRVYLPKGTYTIAVTSSVSATIYYDFGNGSTSLGNTTAPRTFTLSENSYCSFWIYKSGGFTPSDYTSIQLEVGDTATTYEAYNGNTYTFAFGQTVYGGHFDNKGTAVVTHGYKDLGTLTWLQDSAYGSYFYTTGFSDKAMGLTNMICTEYANATGYGNQQPDLTIRGAESGNVHRLFIRNNAITDATTFNTAIQGVMLCYELETPITLAITSQDIATLLGRHRFVHRQKN